MKPRLLITGASGFIGTNLLEQLSDPKQGSRRYDILAVDLIKPKADVAWEQADITATDWGFLDTFKPDYVIHLAALTNERLCADFSLAKDINVKATRSLFSKLVSLGGVKKVIFPSSIVVYANNAPLPLSEDESPVFADHNNYSKTKGMCERLCEEFRKVPFNLPILTFRIANLYGPHQEWRPDRFPNLIPQIIVSALKEKRIEVWTGKPVRDFVYVGDAVQAFVKGLDTPYCGTVNIASGAGTSVENVCRQICAYTGASFYDQGKQTTGPANVVCDTRKAKEYLAWEASTPLSVGLKKTIDFYAGALELERRK